MKKLDNRTLLLGDWVLVEGDNKPHKVTMLSDGDTFDDIYIMLDGYLTIRKEEDGEWHLSGVPLTTDMLIKNGFKEFTYKSGQKKYTFALDKNTKAIWKDNTLTIEMPGLDFLHVLGCRYVHTIKHVFNTFGFDVQFDVE